MLEFIQEVDRDKSLSENLDRLAMIRANKEYIEDDSESKI
jgi:hypothetical protein